MLKTKEIVLSVLLAIGAAIAGFAWDKILENPYWAFAMLAYALIFAVFLVLVKNIYAKWGVALGSFALFVLFFKVDAYWASGFALSALIMSFAVQSEIDDERASVKVMIKRRVGSSIKIFFTALAVFLAFVYYGGISGDANPEKMILPESVFKTGLRLFERPLQSSMPGFHVDATTGELFGPLERQALSMQFGINLTGKEKISDVMYNFTISQITSYAGDFLNYVPIVAAISYFLALKTASVLLFYIALILLFVLFKLLIAMGIVQKVKVPTEQEIYV